MRPMAVRGMKMFSAAECAAEMRIALLDIATRHGIDGLIEFRLDARDWMMRVLLPDATVVTFEGLVARPQTEIFSNRPSSMDN